MATTTVAPTKPEPQNPAHTKGLALLRGKLGQHWRTYLGQLLALLVIWGVAGFAWGSLHAWGKHRANQQLQFVLQGYEPLVTAWLNKPFGVLQQIVGSQGLSAALGTQFGVAGPPVNRALATTAAAWNEPDLLIFDATTEQLATVAGSTPPPPEVLKRLAALPATTQKMVTSGTRNGMLYAALRVPGGQVGQQVYLIRPQSLRQLAGVWAQGAPQVNVALSLALPHTEGQALWQASSPLRLVREGLAVGAQVRPSRWLPEVTLAAAYIKPPPALGWFPKLVILVAALAASVAVCWEALAPIRQRIGQALHPWLGPVQRLWQGCLQVMKNMQKIGYSLAQKLPLFTQGWRSFLQRFQRTEDGSAPTAETQFGAATALASLAAEPSGLGGNTATLAGAQAPRAVGVGGQGARRVSAGNPAMANSPVPGSAASGSALNKNKENLSRTEATDSPPADPSAQEVLTQRVQRCVQQGLLEVLYQPIYEASTGGVFANEVLARLADEDGVISPAQFMPILTSLGQIATLDALVFERMIATHFDPSKVPSTKLSLNVSGTSLEDITYLRDVAQRGPSVLKHLIFEVRSNEMMRDANALQLLKALQRQEAKIAIDYFGGGPTMVQATQALGLDFIKLDAMRLNQNRSTKKEFVAVCVYAQELKIPVVIEKIEDHAMEALARRAGATLLQGYGLGKPNNNLMTLPLSAKLTQD